MTGGVEDGDGGRRVLRDGAPVRETNPWYDDVASVDALVRAGHLRTTVRRRVQRGTWREPAPGVICRTTGPLSDDQRLQAALLYGGPGAALSHATAGRFWGSAVRRRGCS
jgi:hypothetical protein